jgi:hypothetical protein
MNFFMEIRMLEWIHHDKLPMYLARSPAVKSGDFRIFYDDVMYWTNFSDLSPTQDLEMLKQKAQEIHDAYLINKEIATEK